GFVGLGPGPLYRRHQALVVPEHRDRRAEVMVTLGLGDELEGREEERGVLLLLHERLEALQTAARGDQRVVAAVLEARLLHELQEDESISRRARVDRERLAAEILDVSDLRH